MAGITIDSDQWASLASAAIFESMSEDSREVMLQSAIAYLMTPAKTSSWDTGKTPIQQAFDNALHTVAQKVVREKLMEDPAITEKILELLGPMINPMLEVEAKAYNDGLSEAIGKAIATWLNETVRNR